MNETRDLVDFATSLRFEDLPAEVVEMAKLCVLDIVGVGLCGSQREWSKIVAEFAKESACVAECGVWGHGWKTSAQYAAMVNGVSAHGIEMDDLCAIFSVHPGAAIVPAALAAWEKTQATGRDVIAAVVAGYEVAFRVGAALLGSARLRFYGSPIKSLFGATVAAGKLLGLDNDTMLNAVGIAGSMASGLREWSADPLGTMVKRFQGGGWPAHNGVMAALLALKGLTGPATILEGERGVCHAFAIEKEPRIEALSKDLGKDYLIMQRETKPYSACGALHTGIDAANEIKTKYKVEPEQIEHIELGCPFRAYDMHNSKRPESVMAAQYSLPFVTALAFFADLSDPSVWDEQILNKPEVVNLAQKVDMHVDEELENALKSLREE